MNLEVRNELEDDVLAIEAVIVAAFLHAPHASYTEQHIVNALRKSGNLSVSLVAIVDGAVAGHVAVSPVSISDGCKGWYGLGPISVAPELQGRGVGATLINEALRVLRKRGASGCVLLGEPTYYNRFGFRAEPGLVLPEVPPEYFQALLFSSPMPQGIVSYHEAFNTSL